MAPGTPPEISAVARQPHSGAAVNIPLDNMDVKEVKVRSVELTDAVAKDKPNYRSRSQVTLCVIILFVTLSKSMIERHSLKYDGLLPARQMAA